MGVGGDGKSLQELEEKGVRRKRRRKGKSAEESVLNATTLCDRMRHTILTKWLTDQLKHIVDLGCR